MGKLFKLIIPILFGMFNLLLLIYPAQVLAAAREGLLLWFNNVLPSLLPFMVGISVLMGLGYVRRLSVYLEPVMRALFNVSGAGGFVLVAGMVSGYPIGAKTVAELRNENQISKEEAQRLVGFCNNAGPLFIVGVAGAGLFGSVHAGYVLWVSHVLAALALGVCLRFFSEEIPARSITLKPIKNNFGYVLSNSIKNAMETLAFVGGTIIFFCVAASLLTMWVGENGLLVGLLEATNGVKMLAQADSKYPIVGAAAVISFGGLSVHVQSVHFLSAARVKVLPYLICKMIHAGLAAGICWVVLCF